MMTSIAIQDKTLKADDRHSGSVRQIISYSTKWCVHYYGAAAPTTSLGTWKGGKTEEGAIVRYKKHQTA